MVDRYQLSQGAHILRYQLSVSQKDPQFFFDVVRLWRDDAKGLSYSENAIIADVWEMKLESV